jgi:hypothetical protein
LTGTRHVATFRSGPERPQGPGGGKRLRRGGATKGREPRSRFIDTGEATVPGSPGRLGPLFGGSRNRVDNARVWGRRERIQRFLGPSICLYLRTR